jgi:hypothetical protein
MNVEKAYKALNSWEVARVFNHLIYTFNAGAVRVEFCGYPVALADLAHRVTGNIPARYIRVKFRGGPSGKRREYIGTLLTVLVDELFYRYTLGHQICVENFLESIDA